MNVEDISAQDTIWTLLGKIYDIEAITPPLTRNRVAFCDHNCYRIIPRSGDKASTCKRAVVSATINLL